MVLSTLLFVEYTGKRGMVMVEPAIIGNGMIPEIGWLVVDDPMVSVAPRPHTHSRVPAS